MKKRSDEERIYQTPIDYIKTLTATKITEFMHANEAYFLFWGFNTNITRIDNTGYLLNDKYDLPSFIKKMKLEYVSNYLASSNNR